MSAVPALGLPGTPHPHRQGYGGEAETPAAPCSLPVPQGCSLPAPTTATLPPSSLSRSREWQEGPPALSPHLRCSSCREVGGREKQAAGTLKFLISISTSGRGNLRRRRGLLQGAGRDTGTLSPAESCPAQLTPRHLLFLHRGNNPKCCSKNEFAWLQSSTGGSSTHLGSSASSMVGSILLCSSLALSQRLLGCSVLPALAPVVGSESPGQGPRGGCSASFQFNQQPRALPSLCRWRAPVLSQPHGHPVIDPGCWGRQLSPAPARLRVPKAWGAGHLCWGDAAYTPSGAALRWVCAARDARAAIQGPWCVPVDPWQPRSGGKRCCEAMGSLPDPARLCGLREEFARAQLPAAQG